MYLNADKISMFGIKIDVLDRRQAVEACMHIIAANTGACHYVVTPNVDHVLTLQKNEIFRDAYRGATLVLADGNPIVWSSKLLGKPLPETVTGSDLVPSVMRACESAGTTLNVFLLGAGAGVAEKAAVSIKKEMPNIVISGCYSPPFGFEKDLAETEKIIARINAAKPKLLVLGLGAPKQEVWISQNAAKLKVELAICAGAVIDFMAGEKPRAPQWMRKLALEWLHRVLSEPKRLASRYAKGAIVFPWLLLKEFSRK